MEGADLRRPRVALVADDIGFRYAIPRALAEHVARLHREVDFVVLSALLDPELRPLVEWRRLPVAAGPTSLRRAAVAFRASRELRRVDADLVQAAFVLVPNRVDIAWVHFSYLSFVEATRGGALDPARRVLCTVASVAERWCFGRRTRLLVVPSEYLARRLETFVPGARVAVCPNGVDVERFRPDGDARVSLRREQGVADDEIVVLCVANHRASKRPEVAVQALAEAAKAFTGKLRLWILGLGHPPELLELARSLGLGERVSLFGFRHDVERFYQAADLFVLPSAHETFSLAGLEAAASGLPLVATRVGAVDELVRDGEAGIAVDLAPEPIGAALARLAADPRLRARLGSTARRRAERYTWERSAQAMLAIYRELLGASPFGSNKGLP